MTSPKTASAPRLSASLALAAAQEGIWLGQRLKPKSARYNAAECIELTGSMDLDALSASISQGVGEADMMRMRIVETPSGLVQTRSDDVVVVQRVELGTSGDVWSHAQAWMRADLQRATELSQGPLYRQALLRAGDQRVFWYHGAHHVALDGFGFAVIARRVAELYSARVAGQALPPCPYGSLEKVIAEDRDYRSGERCERDRAFWSSHLADMPAPVTLGAQTAFASEQTLRASAELSVALQERLSALAATRRGTWGDALIAAVALYVHRKTGAHEVVLGLPVMGRLGSAALRVPCMAMNIVPLRLPVSASDSFAVLIERVVAALRLIRPHSRYRYEQLRRDLGLLGGERRLFGPVVNLMPFDVELRFGEQRAVVHNIAAGPTEDLSIGISSRGDGRGLELQLDANPACYTALQVLAHRDAFLQLVERCVAEPEQAAPSACAQLFGEALAAPAKDVVTLFASHVRDTPEAIAVEHLGERVSYAELQRRAGDVAATLVRAGARRDTLVAVMLPRSIDAIVAIFGVLMAGAAYLPLDPEGPEERSKLIVADASPLLVLTDRPRPELAVPSLQLAECGPAEPYRREGGLAYVIYTSGSTGKPNGVLIERTALAHFVAAASQRYGVRRSDRVLQFAPLHFDASVEEIFLTLCRGATLVLRTEEMLQSIPQLLRACAEHQLSVLDLPTAYWHELAYTLSTAAGVLPACVRVVIIGGEAALPERVQRFRDAAPRGTQLFNTYGPTEATVVATSALLSGEGALATPGEAPIGTPLPGLQAVVVDRERRPVRGDAVGELCLLGAQLGRGYLGRDTLENERFVALSHLPGAPRAYRTGDLVRLCQGQLCFVGRVDDELKISGFRVDVLEVERVLLDHSQVREACVVVQSAGENKRLCAHVVVHGQGEPLAAAELRAHAQTRLLAAAIPASFVFRDSLPRTRTGKLDRAALRALPVEVGASVVAPSDPLQRTIWATWKDVLGVDDLSVHDDFFQRGGQSLLTLQVANRLGVVLGREVPVALVFRHPTIAELAAALSADDTTREGTLPKTLLADATLPEELRALGPVRPPHAARQVLLTGATGFVGIHLLSELLGQSGARVVCLVRAADETAALQRLQQSAARHGLGLDWSRVRAVVSDLALPQLGLSDPQFDALAAETDTLYHNAATVSLTRGYASLRAENVLATREIIRLATTVRAKAIHHVSTLAVAPGAALASEVPERFVALHDGLRDGYTQSKWAAERLLEQAAERGVEVSVYRLGRVVGPVAGGFVNADDIVWRLLRAGLPLGVLPRLDVSETWTPVDHVARAVVALSLAEDSHGGVFNLAAEPEVRLLDVFGWVQERGYTVVLLPMPLWLERLRAQSDAESAATLSFFDLQASQREPTKLGLGRVRAERTHAALARRGIVCPRIDREVVGRYLEFCVSAGLLPAPHAPAQETQHE
jgi:nonribosomal peptide synthetase MxcG